MNSPKQNDQTIQDGSEAETKAPEETRPEDEQSQATIEEFDEEGMGVAPKE